MKVKEVFVGKLFSKIKYRFQRLNLELHLQRFNCLALPIFRVLTFTSSSAVQI
jgi:hypothetical protein